MNVKQKTYIASHRHPLPQQHQMSLSGPGKQIIFFHFREIEICGKWSSSILFVLFGNRLTGAYNGSNSRQILGVNHKGDDTASQLITFETFFTLHLFLHASTPGLETFDVTVTFQ